MTKNHNMKTCTICGKEYNYCPQCEVHNGWKFYADTTECYQVFHILQEIREGVLTEIEAVEAFKSIGINSEYDFDKFVPAVAKDIQRIITQSAKEVKTISKNK